MKTLALAVLLVAAPGTNDPVVISANGISVKKSEFEKALESLPAEYQSYAKGAGKKQFAEDFLRMKLLAAAGTKAGLDKDPKVVEQLRMMRENLVANAQLEKLEREIVIREADLKKKYDARKSEYEEIHARHILIAFTGSPAAQADKPPLTEDQAKAKAEKLRQQIVGGTSFEELAKKESDDTGSGANGGSLGEFGRGQMVPEFEKACLDAKIGEVTLPVRSQYGYHVIRVDRRDYTPFEEVRPLLERNERQEAIQSALKKLNDDAKPNYDATYFGAPN